MNDHDWRILPPAGDPACPALRISRQMVRITRELWDGMSRPKAIDFWVDYDANRFGLAAGDLHVVREYEPDHALRIHSTMPARVVSKRSHGVWLSCVRGSSGVWYAQVFLDRQRQM